MKASRICKATAWILFLLPGTAGWAGAASAEKPRTARDGPGPVAQSMPATALFAHVAIGAGFSTLFTLLNTGSDPLVGSLILTKSDGAPMDVALSSASAETSGADFRDPVPASSADLTIPPGGVRFIEAKPATSADPLITGWARVESIGGTMGGVATFQLQSGEDLISIAGVLSAAETNVATIPATDDISLGRYTGYAAANHGSNSIYIKIVVVEADGKVRQTLRPTKLNPLKPGEQIARFLFQDMNDAEFKFQGSMVLIADGGQKFDVVALVQSQGAAGPLYTVIPVIPAKAPGIN